MNNKNPMDLIQNSASAQPAVSLKPELFEGLRFDFNKGINQKFSLTHSVFMGSVEVRSLSRVLPLTTPPLSAY